MGCDDPINRLSLLDVWSTGDAKWPEIDER